MQMGSKEDESERFSHYIHKSFKKTASLIAYTCKAVALLSGANQSVQEAAFQYGRNLGIAFQLVDDLLDFVSSQQVCDPCDAIVSSPSLATDRNWGNRQLLTSSWVSRLRLYFSRVKSSLNSTS